jgi:flagellar biosynthesis protein
MVKSKYGFAAAVALEYAAAEGDPDSAPTVTLKGAGFEAAEIVRLARRFGVPVVDDAPTAQALLQVPLEREIPPALYAAVAVIVCRLEALAATRSAARRGGAPAPGGLRSGGAGAP